MQSNVTGIINDFQGLSLNNNTRLPFTPAENQQHSNYNYFGLNNFNFSDSETDDSNSSNSSEDSMSTFYSSSYTTDESSMFSDSYSDEETSASSYATDYSSGSAEEEPLTIFEKFCLNDDDSSDEETSNRISNGYNFSEQYNNFCSRHRYSTSFNDIAYSFVLHTIGVGVMHSEDVNSDYYLNKKPLLKKNLDEIQKNIQIVLKRVILSSIKNIITSVYDKIYDKRYMQLSKDNFITLLNQNISPLLNAIINNNELINMIVNKLTFCPRGLILLDNDIKNKLFSELHPVIELMIKELITNRFLCINWSYNNQYSEIFERYRNYCHQTMIDGLLQQLYNCGWLNIRGSNYEIANKATRSISWGKVYFPNLVNKFIEVIANTNLKGGTNAKNYINNICLADYNQRNLQYAYMLDLSNLSFETNCEYMQNCLTFMQIENSNTPQIAFLFYKPKLVEFVLKNYISKRITKTVFEGFQTNIPSIVRKILPDDHKFVSNNYIEFISNLRLSHRSQTRKIKNYSSSPLLQRSGQPESISHHNYYFGNHGLAQERKIVSHRQNQSRSRQDWVDSAGAYVDILNALNGHIKHFNEYDSGFITDSYIAHWVKEIICGKEKLTKIDDSESSELFHIDEINELKKDLIALSHLLFGCEATRNPASIPIHQMMLDLIVAGRLSWENALIPTLSNHFTNGGIMPMSAKGAIASGRNLNKVFGDFWPKKYNYQGSEAIDGISIEDMSNRERCILFEWLQLKQYPITNPMDMTMLFDYIKAALPTSWNNI